MQTKYLLPKQIHNISVLECSQESYEKNQKLELYNKLVIEEGCSQGVALEAINTSTGVFINFLNVAFH
jgi:hypothetical protein